MRLSTIIAEDIWLNSYVRQFIKESIYQSSVDTIDVRIKSQECPFSLYLLGEAQSNAIIKEAAKDYINAGIAKLQAIMAPGITSEDYIPLVFMAPKVSVNQLQQLINNASNVNASLFNDDNWFNSLFNMLNINSLDRLSIIDELKSDFDKYESSSQQQSNTQSNTQSNERPLQSRRQSSGSGGGSLAQSINAEKGASLSHIDDIKSALAQVTANRQKAQQELAKINAKISELSSKLPKSTKESIDELMHAMLVESDVPDDIIIRSLKKYLSHVPISEADWNQITSRTNQFIGGIRQAVSNPQSISRNLSLNQIKSLNQLIAKNAVKMAINILRQRFNNILQKAGYKPAIFAQIYHQWVTMKQQKVMTPQFQDFDKRIRHIFKICSNTIASQIKIKPPPPAKRVTPKQQNGVSAQLSNDQVMFFNTFKDYLRRNGINLSAIDPNILLQLSNQALATTRDGGLRKKLVDQIVAMYTANKP